MKRLGGRQRQADQPRCCIHTDHKTAPKDSCLAQGAVLVVADTGSVEVLREGDQTMERAEMWSYVNCEHRHKTASGSCCRMIPLDNRTPEYSAAGRKMVPAANAHSHRDPHGSRFGKSAQEMAF